MDNFVSPARNFANTTREQKYGEIQNEHTWLVGVQNMDWFGELWLYQN